MKHPDTESNGLGRGIETDGLVIEPNLTTIGREKTGENLHERALACAILTQQAVKGTRFNRKGDPIIGLDRSKTLVDVFEFNLHGL